MPVEQLQSTLDIFITKVKALGEKADSLDRVLVAQKADSSSKKRWRSPMKASPSSKKRMQNSPKPKRTSKRQETDTVRQQREANLRKRFELLIARGRALDSRYRYQDAAETFRDAEVLMAPQIAPITGHLLALLEFLPSQMLASAVILRWVIPCFSKLQSSPENTLKLFPERVQKLVQSPG